MITDIQIEFIKKYYGKPLTDLTPKERKAYGIYMKRIQKQIDKNERNVLWLAKNHPELYLNNPEATNKHKRLQNLLLLIKILKPKLDVYLEIAKKVKEIL